MKVRSAERLTAPVRMRPPCPAPSAQRGTWTRLSLDLPANLREWFCDSLIAFWIEQELKKVESDQTGSLTIPAETLEGETAGQLSVLVFGYAGLIFGSDEIARACCCDPSFRRLSRHHVPFPRELRSLRRRCRALLERTLTGVFIQAITRKFGLSSALLPIELEEDLRQHAAERLDLARHMDTNPAGFW